MHSDTSVDVNRLLSTYALNTHLGLHCMRLNQRSCYGYASDKAHAHCSLHQLLALTQQLLRQVDVIAV